ncbi:SDR family NAD(P)-dependent oxidoreductase [Streptomyces sp. ST2-7A]|uniref:SDR family NAD(P)-dependent oxidoreductase n=1 Tax=Streptomyces sp. ST2-7A TaxID=2907214 RepID=UPI001F17D78A|nr:SDR family NAD(P)-dependent oxidoreductase [Streptomyces sp. ST2-7A]MCE7082634.1 SDR family NAD(P)-dependent oxidoreductase [Streptomyces sp. ST2-7A]
MPSHPFEHATDGAALAGEVLAALRARGHADATDTHSGVALADRIERLGESLGEQAAQCGEPVRVVAADPLETVLGCLAVWLSGAVPGVGAGAGDGPPRLVLDVARDTARSVNGERTEVDAALLVSEDLVGCVAHPRETLGRLRLPVDTPGTVVVLADWRVDAWLPLVLEAWVTGVERLSLRTGGPVTPDGEALLACPTTRLVADPALAAESAFTTRVTWGAGTGGVLPAGCSLLHGFGDHFVLAVTRVRMPDGARTLRGEVPGRHRVCNAAGRPLPTNAHGLLALAGRVPVIGDTVAEVLGAMRAEPGERVWLTDHRARRRNDHTIEFDLRELDALRIAGRRLSPTAVTRVLAEAGLPGAALVTRDADTDRARAVLCTVGDAPDRETLARLSEALPPWVAPLSGCRVPTLPRDAEGRVDTARLAAEAPPDDLLLESTERALTGGDGGPVRLRTVPVPTRGAELALPDGFAAGGGRYPATRPAEASGPPLTPVIDNLVDRLRRAAATDRGIPLIDGEGRERRLTYAELLTDASRVAAHLRSRGLGHGDEVIIHSAAAGDIFAGVWACILIGVLPVPLTPGTPYDAAGNPLWHLLGPDTMLTGRTVLTTEAQREVMREVMTRRGLTAESTTFEEARSHEPLPAEEVAPRSPALMILTSGSTGAPKGVALSHDNLVSLAESIRHEFDLNDEVSFNWLGVDHVGGLVQHHMRDLCLAQEQVHADTGWVLADPTRILDLLDRYRVTISWMANFGFNLINEQAERIAEGEWDLGRVKVWENGGEPVTHEGNQRFLALLAPHGLVADVIKPVFGMTETSSAIIGAHNLVAGRQDYVHWLSDTTPDRPVQRALPGEGSPFAEVGTPMAGISLRVVDSEGRVCPEGMSGRIEVSGPQVMKGYYRNPGADAETFAPDGWLRMGDCGFMVNGSLVVTGREKDVLIINGLNYAARALENTVEAVPGVRQGCCAAVSVRRPDAVTDDLVVFYSSTVTGAADATAIETALVSEHSLRPVALVEIGPDDWPRTAIGKIRRPVLARGFGEGEFADRITLRRDSALGNRTGMPAWHFVPEWRRAEAPEVPPAHRVLWLGDRPPSGVPLSASPGAPFEGFDAEGGARFRADREEELRALLDAAARRLGGLEAVVDARWNTPPADDGVDTAAHALREARTTWGTLFRAAARMPGAPAVVLATRAAVAVDGDEPSVAHAALPGVAESLAQSHPRLDIVLVDGAPGTALLTECALRGGGQVAHREGVRWVRGLRPLDGAIIPHVPRRILREHGTYLVIGGLGGIGAHLTQHLVRLFGARVLVAGRGPAEPGTARGEVLAHLSDQTGAGSEVRYVRLDAGDAGALRTTIDAVEHDWGALDGVFNLVGEGSVTEQLEAITTSDTAVEERLFARAQVRMRVTHALEEALAERDAPVVLFGSVNGFFGGAGFAEYAGACSYQSAHGLWTARRSGRTRICLDWSMWKQVGMASGTPSTVVELARRRGFESLTPARGLASLHTALESAEDRLLIGLSVSGDAVVGLLPFDSVGYDVEAEGVDDTTRVASMLGVDRARVCRTHTTPSGTGSTAGVTAGHTEALLGVFRDVLGTPGVGAEDNFFAAGGDSIRAIQVVARADEHGFRFSPLDLFEHKTAAALLAHLAGRDELADAVPREDDGEPVIRSAVPPIFAWWLETADRREVRDHLTMSMRYRVDGGLTPDAVEAALIALVERHDALRMRLIEAPEGWQLVAGESVADSLRFETREVATGREAVTELDGIEPALHHGVSAEEGPMCRAVLARPADASPSMLLLVIHHAAVDGVSWRIIEEELRLLLEARAHGVEAELPPTTMGFLKWAHRMERRSLHPDGGAAADHWAELLAGGWGALPGETKEPLLEGDTEILTRKLQAHLFDRPGENSVYELLLTAVAWSLTRWAGIETLALDVEGHGRLDTRSPADLSRTVGWFTAIAPVRLDLSGLPSPGRAIPRVRRALTGLRGRDQEWGLLRYGRTCPPNHPLRHLPERRVGFNYLGVFDGGGHGPDQLFAALPGSLGAEQSPEAERRYLIEIAAAITDGEPELSVKFSPTVHTVEEVGQWLDRCETVLRDLLTEEGEEPKAADVDDDELLLALQEVSLGSGED